MNIFIVKTKIDEHGCGPNLPEYISGFLLIAETNGLLDFNIYKVSGLKYGEPLPEGTEAIPKELETLIYSAQINFSPAMAISRDELNHQLKGYKTITKEQYLNLYTSILRDIFESQPTKKYFLVEAKQQVGYVSEGEFVWVVGFNKERQVVKWVSSDYFVYPDPVIAFKFNSAQLELLNSLDDYTYSG